ncbi:MAG TPA: hypothetical protein VE999_01325, partial [Gemmataceae bacterium]|nr:hypothetical protein [Gemmataceae bacterium]
AWRVARGAWRVARGAWRVARGAWRVARGAWRVARGAGEFKLAFNEEENMGVILVSSSLKLRHPVLYSGCGEV